MSLTMEQSVRRQVRAMEQTLNEWRDLTIEYKNNKSVLAVVTNKIPRIEVKLSEMKKSLLKLEEGMMFTSNGWEYRNTRIAV